MVPKTIFDRFADFGRLQHLSEGTSSRGDQDDHPAAHQRFSIMSATSIRDSFRCRASVQMAMIVEIKSAKFALPTTDVTSAAARRGVRQS
jgi:hypothetical protein